MATKKATERVVRTAAPLPPIRVGAQARTASTRLDLGITLFLRLVALLWIAGGILQWYTMLTDDPEALVLPAMPLRVAALFFFCILDFVAAVGLWLVTTWGVAVWVATIVGHGLAVAFTPGFVPEPGVVLAGDVLLLAAYAALATFTARTERRR